MIELIYEGEVQRNNGVSIEKDFITGNRLISPITYRQLLAFLSQFESIRIKSTSNRYQIEVLDNAISQHK